MRGALISRFHFRGIPSPSGMKFGHEILETLGYHTMKTRSLYLAWVPIGIRTWQSRQTDRITVFNTRCSYASSRV